MGGFRPSGAAAHRRTRGASEAGGGDPEGRDPEAVARSLCLRQLTMGPRSRGQLAEVLTRGGVPDDIAARVLDRLTEVCLIDDAAFAETWVRSRSASRGLSRRALADELRARGVAEEVVSDAVAGRSDEDDAAAARTLVERRLRATRGLDRDTRLRRLTATLARKGYPGGLAVRIVREALADERADVHSDDAGWL